MLSPLGGLAHANLRARALLNLPRDHDPAADAVDRAGLAERLGLSEPILAAALRRASGQGDPTPLGLRPTRIGNAEVLCGAVETLRQGGAVRGHLITVQPPTGRLRGFAHLTDELGARSRDLAAQRAASQALQAERDRARMVAEVIAEDIGAPAGRIASRLSMILRAPGLIGSASAREALEVVSEDCWRLLDTVATVLEHGAREPLALEGEPVDLAACLGEALSRLRVDPEAGRAPICDLGPPVQLLGDWRLTPLLLQRCLSYVAHCSAEGAQLRVQARPRRKGEPLTLVFSASGRPTPGARGPALVLALRDLAHAHGWEAAPGADAGPTLTLSIPAQRIAENVARPFERGLAPQGSAR